MGTLQCGKVTGVVHLKLFLAVVHLGHGLNGADAKGGGERSIGMGQRWGWIELVEVTVRRGRREDIGLNVGWGREGVKWRVEGKSGDVRG